MSRVTAAISVRMTCLLGPIRSPSVRVVDMRLHCVHSRVRICKSAHAR